MDLVIDANILFAALIRNEMTSDLIFLNEIHLYAPEFLLEEFTKHEKEILKKSEKTHEEFDKFKSILKKRIKFYPYSDFKHNMEKADNITPDKDDSAYIALALTIGSSIWSNDKALKSVKEVTVFSTSDLVKIYSKYL